MSSDKIKERVECSEGRGRGGRGSFIVAKRRGGGRCPIGRATRTKQVSGTFDRCFRPPLHCVGT